ncbi:MAG: DUF192 domain-containing protein [archaeon]
MIKNSSNKKVLTKNKTMCNTIVSQSKGLMFSKEKKDFGLIFNFKKERTISLHMFFVFYPIDVISLDAQKKVIDVKENFKPFTTYLAKKKAKYIIELPKGTIKRTSTKTGDIIEF